LAAAGDIPSSILGGLVPESGLVRSVAQMTDPSQRAVLNPRTPQDLLQSIGQNVQQNIPGLRETLPVRQDILGRPANNPLQGLGELSPMRLAAGQQTPILQAMENANVAPALPPSTVAYGRYQQIALNPAEQRAWQQIHGGLLEQAVGPMVASPGWQAQSPQSQHLALQQVDQKITQATDRMMLGVIQNPGQRVQPTPGGALAPVVGYGPNVMSTQMLVQQQLQRNAQSQALIQSLLPSGRAG
jgi:hypothetical protein